MVKKIEIFSDFQDFLRKYSVFALAVAVIMGGAVNKLAQSFVNDIVMPVITQFIPNGGWESATVTLGSAVIRWGLFLSALLNFFILATFVFAFTKIFFRKKDEEKQKT